MAIIQVISNSAVLAALLLLVSRVFQPWARRSWGQVIHKEPLSLLGRLRMFGLAGVALLLIAAIGWWFGYVSATILAVAALGLVLLVATPVSYTLTPRGIALGRTTPRRWTEFGGVSRQRWGVRLQGVTGGRRMTVWLSGGRDDDAFVLLLRKLVRASYQGRLDPVGDPTAETAIFADGLHGVVGVTS